ncbi:MAG: response regulator [Proteobacteria bacterium]|nr:response regulator [Pseudomonadota bacterium]
MSQYVVRQLRLLGYQVMHAPDGPSALEIVRSSVAIDLLFADVVMPGGMNGLEVAAAAREIRSGLRVLFASGYPEAVLARHEAPVPEFAMLQKPYQVVELARALRQALGATAASAR